ncbi:MAG: 2-dehydropantoate 2-reductase [Rhizomicrobium sp.]|jgi:2-dehydropantoate 2-reductase
MRIAIVGAGAIGGWLAARLAAAGQYVSVLARGPTLAAIRANGLMLCEAGRTVTLKMPASDEPRELGPQDLVIVAVKGQALPEAALSIAPMVGLETVVLPAMNGVTWWFTHGLGGTFESLKLTSIDPDGTIAEAIPPSRVIGCVVHASSSVTAPGVISHTAGNRLIVGEPNGRESPRLARVADVLHGAGFGIEVSDRIQQDVWYKLWGNMTMNPISALTRATTDKILDDALVRTFALTVMAEAKEVGAAVGCAIGESGEDRMAVTRKLGAIRTSMLQDVEAGRSLEIDALLSAPREIARAAGLATPHMDALHGLVRLFDAMRQDAFP